MNPFACKHVTVKQSIVSHNSLSSIVSTFFSLFYIIYFLFYYSYYVRYNFAFDHEKQQDPIHSPHRITQLPAVHRHYITGRVISAEGIGSNCLCTTNIWGKFDDDKLITFTRYQTVTHSHTNLWMHDNNAVSMNEARKT